MLHMVLLLKGLGPTLKNIAEGRCHIRKSIQFTLIYKNKTKQKNQGSRENEIFCPLVHSPDSLNNGLAPGDSRSHELHQVFHMVTGTQGPRNPNHHPLLPRHMSRKLDWKCRSQDGGQHPEVRTCPGQRFRSLAVGLMATCRKGGRSQSLGPTQNRNTKILLVS